MGSWPATCRSPAPASGSCCCSRGGPSAAALRGRKRQCHQPRAARAAGGRHKRRGAAEPGAVAYADGSAASAAKAQAGRPCEEAVAAAMAAAAAGGICSCTPAPGGRGTAGGVLGEATGARIGLLCRPSCLWAGNCVCMLMMCETITKRVRTRNPATTDVCAWWWHVHGTDQHTDRDRGRRPSTVIDCLHGTDQHRDRGRRPSTVIDCCEGVNPTLTFMQVDWQRPAANCVQLPCRTCSYGHC